MNDWLERSRLLLGDEKLEKLQKAHVLLVGLGGVGGYAGEALCRSGIGHLTLVDGDHIQVSNRNRQLVAMQSSQGKNKTDVLAERLLDINPELKLNIITEYIKDERMEEILEHPYDFVLDAIDTLTPKVFLIYHSLQRKLPIISSMGAGGKLDPSQIQIKDLSKSYNCPLARFIRKRLRKLDIHGGFPVVFSPEKHDKNKILITEDEANKKSTVGTISYMPALFGLHAASYIIRHITGDLQSGTTNNP